MERGKVSTSEAMVDHAQQTYRGERLSAKTKNEVNKDNSLSHITFSVLFVYYKREEVEIRHEPYWYDKEEPPSLTSTQIVFFDEIHIQQMCVPPMTSKMNEHNICFPRDEEGNVDVKNDQYGKNNQPKRPPSSMNNKEGSALV